MSEDVKQKVTHHLHTKLHELSCIPFDERRIFRVNDGLRMVNEESYQPKTIAIGPYHHHKHYPLASTIRLMEELKLRYLQNLLKRGGEISVENYVVAMQKLEERVRKCYAEPINDLDSEEFVKMMVLDGCFIVEFLCIIAHYEFPSQDNPFVLNPRIYYSQDDQLLPNPNIFDGIVRDLSLFENQLPLFVLVDILDITMTSSNIILLSLPLIISFGKSMAFVDRDQEYQEYLDLGKLSVDGIEHLLGLMHCCWCYPFRENKLKCQENVAGRAVEFIKSATELQETGVKFEAGFGTTLFDITFAKGKMKIPTLSIYDGTESFLRNLVAYEQYRPNKYQKYFTDYAILMDCLVNSSNDVQILRDKEIIVNGLGNDEVISTIFNNLCLEVSRSEEFQYLSLFTKIDDHCQTQCNLWMATLRRNYFHNPWAIISFFAAFILLILTVAQTIFSVLSFFR